MKIKILIIGFCMFFTGLIALAFVCDIIKTAIAKHKKQDYKWQSIGVFQEATDAFTVLVWGVALIIGFYGFFIIIEDEIASRYELSMEECWRCESEYPTIYGVRDFYGNIICIDCMRSEMAELSSGELGICAKCNEPYSKNWHAGYGLCEDCFDENYRECSQCGNYAPTSLYDQYDECICEDCITEALHDKNVARAVQRYFEYG